MDVEDLDLLLDIAEQNAIDVEWEQGDLIILDVSEPRPVASYSDNGRIMLFNTRESPGMGKDRSWLRCGMTLVG